ncbi:ABC transporter permease [Candidatus Njordibacter sp. Uisw_002]|jgi:ribose/xylose/arabinose/galactoside ABC-type transport system permease subunit|uniref:ABC transporter permease n=1 Tax=Candidatus Njordibacter sp. Uisw_002 TaxID=3230971 RepID=UPI003D3DAD69
MSAAAESKRSAGAGKSTAVDIVKQNGLNIFLAIIALVFIGFAITTHNYLTLFNIKTIVRDAALVGIMGIGLTFVTLSGNFFLLSMKETAALCIITFATSMSHDFGFVISLAGAVAVAMISGGLQGLLIGRGGNPIVVTLGAAGILYGIASWWSDNLVISFRRPNDAEWLGTGSVMGIPNITITFIVIAIIAELVLRKTSFGRQVYLIGANRAAGKATGHENRSMAIKVCMIASVCCAIVAVAFSAQMSSAQANYFSSEFGSSGDFTILVIATVMVAGNSIMGGYGSTLRTSLGAVFISAVDNMMVLQGYNSGPRVLSVGLMIVFSILVFAYIRRDNRSEG